MHLIKPNKQYTAEVEQALKAFEAENTTGFWNNPTKPQNIDEYIKRAEDRSQGINLPPHAVPNSTYWLIDNDRFVRQVNIRHHLNESLEKRGGHIGYSIPPFARNQGYGTKILELALSKAQTLGLSRVLITCSNKNIHSQKIIEKNGGVLQDIHDVQGEMVRRYWIEL